MKEANFLNILQAQKGKIYLVKNINLQGKIESRLITLGITAQVKFMVINKKNQDAMIIKVRGTRFAIDKKIANAIEIEEIKDE